MRRYLNKVVNIQGCVNLSCAISLNLTVGCSAMYKLAKGEGRLLDGKKSDF